jgi:hypothetical protein
MNRLRILWASAASRLTTLRVRLTLWYVVLLAIILAGYSAILVVSMSRGLEAGLDRVLSDGVRQAVGVLGAVRDERELREEFRRINVGTIIGLYDLDGQQLIVGRTLPPPFDHPVAPTGAAPRIETVTNGEGASWRVLIQQVSSPGEPDRLLLVARSAGFIQVAVSELGMLIAASGPLTLLLAIAGGAFLAGRALDPINHITRTAEAITAEHLSRRLALRRAGQHSPLVRSGLYARSVPLAGGYLSCRRRPRRIRRRRFRWHSADPWHLGARSNHGQCPLVP